MIVTTTDLDDIQLFKRGKVRDVYELDGELLLIATDRISAFDVVLPSPIPDKGRVLNSLSAFWFAKTGNIVPNHMITHTIEEYPDILDQHTDLLNGRSMLVKKTNAVPVECVVRGYLSGSGWREYGQTGNVCGISLPSGLRESDRLETPIFTPSTKAETGHDENINHRQMFDIVGHDVGNELIEKSQALYAFARAHAEERGIILADTKFEFGLTDDGLILIDEALTPDSSRFWDSTTYEPGRGQESLDKQFVRDHLDTLDWNKQPPAPELPPDVIDNTRARYLEAYQQLTGESLPK